MSDIAIRVENLGMLCRIGERERKKDWLLPTLLFGEEGFQVLGSTL